MERSHSPKPSVDYRAVAATRASQQRSSQNSSERKKLLPHILKTKESRAEAALEFLSAKVGFAMLWISVFDWVRMWFVCVLVSWKLGIELKSFNDLRDGEKYGIVTYVNAINWWVIHHNLPRLCELLNKISKNTVKSIQRRGTYVISQWNHSWNWYFMEHWHIFVFQISIQKMQNILNFVHGCRWLSFIHAT